MKTPNTPKTYCINKRTWMRAQACVYVIIALAVVVAWAQTIYLITR